MAQSELLSRITARPDVFRRQADLRDMRISVESVLSLLAHGMTPDAIVGDYPNLELDDIRACAASDRAVPAQSHSPRKHSLRGVFWGLGGWPSRGPKAGEGADR